MPGNRRSHRILNFQLIGAVADHRIRTGADGWLAKLLRVSHSRGRIIAGTAPAVTATSGPVA